MLRWLLAQSLKRALCPFIQQAGFFKTALLFEQRKQEVERVLVCWKAEHMLLQDLFR